ncbi:helix-turn-helix transcriptional regulator [Cohnella fermenti]|uniref:Helix-turn-helix domain-containing protein n=1 Tax=Cohnella fermenti TaxID=2565925 RepID=A0A4S4BWM9_9BACL|nr:helix-turn-helix transcriptional regulator [Cohnella fermenti]THF79604.1 helix-turn-helix domain-containing protein [Cohnella fermenti]
MNRSARLQALSAFLQSQRAKLRPSEAGFPEGGRRRTPGLRREEVAQLAGVSLTWYTWLEQGRDIQASSAVLDAIASALRLTKDERKYLFSLALESGEPAPLPQEPPRIDAPLRHILKELASCPTIVSDRRCQIVGWNEAASHIFLDFDRIAPERRNLIRLLFERKEFRRLAVNWELFVGGFLAIFRSYYGEYVGDGWYETFLEEMSELDPDFLRLWEASKVSSAPEMVIEFRHAKAGKMQFHLTSLMIHGSPDLRCSVYTPDPGTTTEEKLRRLMARTQSS